MLSVVIPWRPQASRVPALELLTDWYERTLPGTVIRLVDTDDPVFNLARCRNAGMADADPDDVVVINDADTIPERGPLLQAVSEAATSGLVHLPYTEYHWLGARGTAQYASGMSAEDCDFELVRGACSGVYVATPQTWFSHGGQDERFRGWGFEDAAGTSPTAPCWASPRAATTVACTRSTTRPSCARARSTTRTPP